MQLVSYLVISTLTTNEFSQYLEFLCATGLETAGIVKDVTRMIGEQKLIVDGVLASLARRQWANEAKYDYH